MREKFRRRYLINSITIKCSRCGSSDATRSKLGDCRFDYLAQSAAWGVRDRLEIFEERVPVRKIVIALAFVLSHHNSYTPMSQQAVKDSPPGGLTSDEARRILEKFGPNALPDTAQHPLRMALENSGRLYRGC